MILNIFKFSFLFFFSLISVSYAQESTKENSNTTPIDLTHWSVTVPGENPEKPGKPIDINYPSILYYVNNPLLKEWMYLDKKDNSIVFYARPTGHTTTNSSYSRSELRENMVPGDKDTNWTFVQGGYFKGTYKIEDVSKESSDKYSRVIVAQIHGRLSNAQRDLIGQKDNNAPPILKVYWDNGKIRVKTKVLEDLNSSDIDILRTDSWGDDEGTNFKEYVGFSKFTIEIKVSDGRLEVILNGSESLVYEDIHMKKWNVFENYFKAGNYFQSKKPNTSAKVKIYSLEVSH